MDDEEGEEEEEEEGEDDDLPSEAGPRGGSPETSTTAGANGATGDDETDDEDPTVKSESDSDSALDITYKPATPAEESDVEAVPPAVPGAPVTEDRLVALFSAQGAKDRKKMAAVVDTRMISGFREVLPKVVQKAKVYTKKQISKAEKR